MNLLCLQEPLWQICHQSIGAFFLRVFKNCLCCRSFLVPSFSHGDRFLHNGAYNAFAFRISHLDFWSSVTVACWSYAISLDLFIAKALLNAIPKRHLRAFGLRCSSIQVPGITWMQASVTIDYSRFVVLICAAWKLIVLLQLVYKFSRTCLEEPLCSLQRRRHWNIKVLHPVMQDTELWQVPWSASGSVCVAIHNANHLNLLKNGTVFQIMRNASLHYCLLMCTARLNPWLIASI